MIYEISTTAYGRSPGRSSNAVKVDLNSDFAALAYAITEGYIGEEGTDEEIAAALEEDYGIDDPSLDSILESLDFYDPSEFCVYYIKNLDTGKYLYENIHEEDYEASYNSEDSEWDEEEFEESKNYKAYRKKLRERQAFLDRVKQMMR